MTQNRVGVGHPSGAAGYQTTGLGGAVSGARAGGAMSCVTDVRGESAIPAPYPRSGRATASAAPEPAQSVLWQSAAAGVLGQQSGPVRFTPAPQ